MKKTYLHEPTNIWQNTVCHIRKSRLDDRRRIEIKMLDIKHQEGMCAIARTYSPQYCQTLHLVGYNILEAVHITHAKLLIIPK